MHIGNDPHLKFFKNMPYFRGIFDLWFCEEESKGLKKIVGGGIIQMTKLF